MTIRSRILVLRADLVIWREHRRWQRQTQRELGSYATQAERDDLLAIFDRYPDEVTREYRHLLDKAAIPDSVARWPAMGRP